jgi:uncharacterized coiled-coil DUF342 family protein
MKTFEEYNSTNLQESKEKPFKEVHNQVLSLTNELHKINNKLAALPKKAAYDKKLNQKLTYMSNELKKVIDQYDRIADQIDDGEYD